MRYLLLALLLFRDVALAEVVSAVKSTRTTTASVTNSAAQVLGANNNRKGFSVWNNSSNSVYLTFGPAPCTSAAPTLIIATFATFQMFTPVVWAGELCAIRNSGSGTLTITEIW
jgi:hypothetical protein